MSSSLSSYTEIKLARNSKTLKSHIKIPQVGPNSIETKEIGFKMSADDSGMAPRILPNQQQVHVIHVKMIGPIQSFGHIIVQYK